MAWSREASPEGVDAVGDKAYHWLRERVAGEIQLAEVGELAELGGQRGELVDPKDKRQPGKRRLSEPERTEKA